MKACFLSGALKTETPTHPFRTASHWTFDENVFNVAVGSETRLRANVSQHEETLRSGENKNKNCAHVRKIDEIDREGSGQPA